MTPSQIEEYLEMVLDVHKTLYIQNKTYNYLYQKEKSLGKKKKFSLPKKESYFGKSIAVGFGFGVTTAVIIEICYFVSCKHWWNILDGLGPAIVFGCLTMIVVSVISAILFSIKANNKYNSDMAEYNKKLSNDNGRVNQEITLQKIIRQQRTLLQNQYYSTKNTLSELASYSIIDQYYINDMVAIASFYQYFRLNRTFSLGFDKSTGDRGAYNIYEDELRQNLIIAKLDEIIYRLDDIAGNQRELYNCLSQANRKISALNKSINKLNSSVKAQTAIEQFNAECVQRELRYLNTMNVLYLHK